MLQFVTSYIPPLSRESRRGTISADELSPTAATAPSPPLSPSAAPELHLLPSPLPSGTVSVGQLICKHAKCDPHALEERDFDDAGTRWYKDVISIDTTSGKFQESLGATHFISEPHDGLEYATIEGEESRVRMLKDPGAAFLKVASNTSAHAWLRKHVEKGRSMGFVTAVREVTNASYRRAELEDAGNGMHRIERTVSGGEVDGQKRKDSGLDVHTNSKTDVVAVEIRKIAQVGGELVLGDVVDEAAWPGLWLGGEES